MKWFAVVSDFPGHRKMQRAYKSHHGAPLMWLAMRGHVARVENTDGRVHDDEIDSLGGAPPARRRALKALVDAGLIERSDDEAGAWWRFHDFEDHAMELRVVLKQRERERSKKAGQRSRKRGDDPGDGSACPPACPPGTPPGRPNGNTPGTLLDLDLDLDRSDPQRRSKDLSGTQRPEPVAPEAAQQRPAVRPVEQIPTSLRDACMVEPQRRAKLGLERKDLLDYAEPQSWPEVRQIVDALGLDDRRNGAPSRDRGVLRAVELLADFGDDMERLLAACERLRHSAWWRDQGHRKGLSSVTAEVVNRELAAGPPSATGVPDGLSPAAAAHLARIRGKRVEA